jgi:CubicO group peptidase (beta-lactamase class C family)
MMAWSQPVALAAQGADRELRYRQPIERSISAGEVHHYSLGLDAGQFAFVAVEQQGIDVVVTIGEPSGSGTVDYDGPSGAQGLEPVVLLAEETGDYSVMVRPLDNRAEPGGYTITLERLEPAANRTAGRIDQLFAPWDRPGSPGAAVAVVRDGAIVHSEGYGSANLEYDIPITPSTVFHAASVSKQFTAFAITMLAVNGMLSLDDDVRTYIPELHDFGPSITIRHLLHHTSGLRDQWSLLTLAGWRMDDVITQDQILRLIARQRYLNFEPGTEYLYSNTGFTLLAEIASRATGQSFSEWTEQHLFRPLGMHSTHFHHDHETIVPNRAYSYRSDPAGGFRKSVLSYANVGATSLFTTVEDLAKWAGNFETGEVGGPEVIRLMRTRGVLTNGDTLDYAFGQAIGSYKGLRALSHSGADAGYRSYLIRFPHQRVSVAVLSNVASFDASLMARQVADLYLADRFVAGANDPDDRDIPRAIELDPALFDGYVGDYELQPGVLVKVSRIGDRLVVDATGRQQVRLVPASQSRFFVEGTDLWVEFERGAGGVASQLTLMQAGQTLVASRIEPFDASAVLLSEFEGAFYSGELAATYRMEVENGTLVAKHLRNDPIALTPSGPDAFMSDAWFMSQVIFVRNRAGEILGLRVSSGRVRNLWFAKLN